MPRGAPTKRFLDIELALRWAYRDELPKRDRTAAPRTAMNERVWSPYTYPAGYPETSPMFREGQGPSGGYADGWTREPGFVDQGPPHPDALLIDAAVQGLRAWRGHGFGPDDPAGLTWGFEGFAADYLQAGIEAVAMMAGLVYGHARAATRPSWPRTPSQVSARMWPPWPQQLPQCFPDTGGNGKPRVMIEERFVEVYDRRRDRRSYIAERELPPETPIGNFYRMAVACPPTRAGLYRMGAYCPLVYRPDPKRLVTQRADYAAWRMGLELVQAELEGRLASIAPVSASAPWRPWAGEGETHGRIPELFRGRRDEPYRRETREQAALRRQAAKRRAERDIRAEQTRPVRLQESRDNGPRPPDGTPRALRRHRSLSGM